MVLPVKHTDNMATTMSFIVGILISVSLLLIAIYILAFAVAGFWSYLNTLIHPKPKDLQLNLEKVLAEILQSQLGDHWY